MRYLLYDVFTAEPLLGNQLAVFPDARGIDPALMQRIAREMNLSESTFVLPAEAPGTDVRMRIFTPAHEMPMAGHPTIGSTFALAHAGAIDAGRARFTFGLNIGPVPVDLEWTGSTLRFAWMTQSRPSFAAPLADRSAAAAALSLTLDDLAPGLPVQQVSCGVPYVLVPLRDRQTVDRAEAATGGFRRLRELTGASVPIYLFATSSRSDETVYSRMFAPDLGIVEDPATGSASGPLGCYLVEHRLVTGDAARRIVNRQGVKMGRASTIHIAIEGVPGAITGVRIGGEAVLIGHGELTTAVVGR